MSQMTRKFFDSAIARSDIPGGNMRLQPEIQNVYGHRHITHSLNCR